MERTATRSGTTPFDRDRAEAEWLRGFPPRVLDGLLGPKELKPLLDAAERALEGEDSETLAEIGSEAYRLAVRLEPVVGREAALRFLRGGMARALEPCILASPECASRSLRLLNRVSDAVWEAHTDALQKTIQQQQYERLHQELMVAKRIQERLLPRTIPEIPGYDIAGRVLPAAEVGGDYWSCKSYPEDDIVTLKLADVTGHGIAAATLVSAVKFISGGYYRGSKTASQVMERTNHVLVKETPHEILVTMFYGWLYPSSHEMSVVNAGHSPVLHLRRGRFKNIPPTGPALGMIETRYRETRIDLEPGDLFFTCSDGVTDPANPMALGEKWVRDLVARNATRSASALVELVLEEALRVYEIPADDMSVLVVKRTE